MDFDMKIPREKICLYSAFNPERSSSREIIEGAARHGVGGVELMSFCEELCTADLNVARELGRLARGYGLKLPCFSVGIDLMENGDEKMELLRRFADICSDLEIPYLHHTIALDFTSGEITDEIREERFKRGSDYALSLMEYARPLGVRTVIEDQGFVFNGIDNCLRLCELSDNGIGIIADVGNIMFWGEKPEDFIRAMRGRVVHAHLKDNIKADAPEDSGSWYPTRLGTYLKETSIGDGDIDYAAVDSAFRDIGYDGMYALEFPSTTDEEELKKMLSRLSAN